MKTKVFYILLLHSWSFKATKAELANASGDAMPSEKKMLQYFKNYRQERLTWKIRSIL